MSFFLFVQGTQKTRVESKNCSTSIIFAKYKYLCMVGWCPPPHQVCCPSSILKMICRFYLARAVAAVGLTSAIQALLVSPLDVPTLRTATLDNDWAAKVVAHLDESLKRRVFHPSNSSGVVDKLNAMNTTVGANLNKGPVARLPLFGSIAQVVEWFQEPVWETSGGQSNERVQCGGNDGGQVVDGICGKGRHGADPVGNNHAILEFGCVQIKSKWHLSGDGDAKVASAGFNGKDPRLRRIRGVKHITILGSDNFDLR